MTTPQITSLTKIYAGKVRDIYALDEQRLLIVATDRISAFDVILPSSVPGKGKLLTKLSCFWFDKLRPLAPNHWIAQPLDTLLHGAELQFAMGRAMLVQRLKPLPIEAIVRGYLIGSGWRDYRHKGTLCGQKLPAGMRLAERLETAIFTPSSKSTLGEHDLNIDYKTFVESVGSEALADRIRELSLQLYRDAAEHARQRGIIIADTKFEFGLDANGQLVWMDEALTPDSSRFWDADAWQPGVQPDSFDKEYVRGYLDTLSWDKTAPGPTLPTQVISRTLEKYQTIVQRLTDTECTAEDL